ncbi:MAG: winged helix-turn-helix transcriptional regulator [Deltaproteobacteria bacterium]|nr:winged helix-turn-helix transcriptional regulator [Deltaproteobacteria bacterium]
MDLSLLIPSDTRRSVLKYFSTNEDAEVYVNELARILELSPQLIYRELIILEEWGYLFSYKRGNQRVFKINDRFVLKDTIKELFEKSECPLPDISEVFDWSYLKKQYARLTGTDEEKNTHLQQNKPRAYQEEKIMKDKGLL